MKLFSRKHPAWTGIQFAIEVPPSDTPIFARLAAESPLPSWDDVEAVAA